MSVLRNTSITLAARYLGNGAKAGAALVVATTLGTAGAGTFALLRVWPHLAAALLGGGITIATPYLVGSRKYPVRVIGQMVTAVGLLMGMFAYAVWVLASGFLESKFHGQLSHGDFLLVGISIPFLLIRNNLNSVQQGLQTFRAANLVLFIEEIVTLLLVLPLFWMKDGNTTLILVGASVGGAVASYLASAIMLLRKGVAPWPRLHWPIAVEAFTFGLKGHIGRVANMLTWRLDILILSAMTTVEIVGLYAVACQAAEMFRPLSASLTYVLRPFIASLSMEEARARGVYLYRRVFAVNLALVGVMALIGGPAIIMLFGEEFRGAILPFQILLIGLAAHGADGVLTGYNVGIGRPEFNTYTALVGLLATLVGDLTLIPPYGVVGAGIASSIAYTVKAVTMTAIFLTTSGVTFQQLSGLKEYSPDAA